jgi:carbonic anhydrase
MNFHFFCKAVLVGSMLIQLITTTFSAAQETHPPHWTYSGAESPKKWGSSTPSIPYARWDTRSLPLT